MFGHVTHGSEVLAIVASAARAGSCAVVLDCGEGEPREGCVPFKRQSGWSTPLDVLQVYPLDVGGRGGFSCTPFTG